MSFVKVFWCERQLKEIVNVVDVTMNKNRIVYRTLNVQYVYTKLAQIAHTIAILNKFEQFKPNDKSRKIYIKISLYIYYIISSTCI